MRGKVLAACFLLGACDSAPKQNDKPSTPPAVAEIANTAVQAPDTSAYQSTLKCYTLADIMDTVAEELDRPELRASGAVRSDWKAAAYAAGAAAGKSISEVDSDYADEYIRIVAPLESMSKSQGADLINQLASRLSDCGSSPK